jgi:hypothetical protein
MTTDHPARPPAEPLRASLESLIAESQALRADVHGAEQARRRANKINMGVLAFVALFVVMLVAIAWQNNQVINQVQQANNRLVDCTTPGGVCYEQGQKRTGAAIIALTRISIYVSQCGRLYPGESGPEYDAKIEKCGGTARAGTGGAVAVPWAVGRAALAVFGWYPQLIEERRQPCE